MRGKFLAAVAAFAMAAPLLVSGIASAATGPVVPVTQFGMTVNALGGGVPIPAGIGTTRLWDVNARWDQVETSRGVYNWAPLDAAVSRAWGAGIRDIMYVMGGTPRWASVPSPAESGDLYGPGTASHPASDTYYLEFLSAVLNRYRTHITSYELWNEPNLPMFYRGTPTQLANLSLEAYRLIKSTSWKPQVASPSWLLRYWIPNREAQLQALKKVGWPFDAFAVHGYPYTEQGADSRMALLNAFRARTIALGAKKPIWDTEVNFGSTAAGFKYKVYTGLPAAGLVARGYIDSLRSGVAKTYWYSWDAHFMGIQMTDSTGRWTTAAVAFRTIRSWLVGNHFNGCTTARGVTQCAISSVRGSKRTIVFTSALTVRSVVPRRATTVCSLDGKCRKATPGTAINLFPWAQMFIGA